MTENKPANADQFVTHEIVSNNDTFIKKTADIISQNQAAVIIFAGAVSTSLVLMAIAKSIAIVLTAWHG